MITRKSNAEIQVMRRAGVIVAEVHAACHEAAAVGVSTAELDAISEEIIRQNGATPTFLGYGGFPGSICASINDEIVHGIPSHARKLKEGDIITVDVGATLDGMVADAATTILIGEVSAEVQQLVKDTRESLYIGIDQARVGNRVRDISSAIERFANEHHYGIVRDYGGHGVGHKLHEEPHIPNHGYPLRSPRLKIGHCIAIEPMLNLGSDDVRVLSDKWTVVTADGKPAAHWEHSLAITERGPMLLTVPPEAEQPFLR